MKRLHLVLRAALTSLAFTQTVAAAQYEWTFNNGSLVDAFNTGLLAPAGATVVNIVNTNGSSIPHIGGVPARVLDVPAFTSSLDGFNVSLNGSVPNGGGAYLNQYTVVFDLLSPGARNWQALFQTDPENATATNNDADWYVAPDGSIGIGALTYSAADLFQQDTWHRIAFAADLGAGRVSFYLDGVKVAERTGASLLDQRFALYSSTDAGPDLRLFNEGDTSGNYTHALYANSIAFVDRELDATEVGTLGGAKAAGIFVPEPTTAMLLCVGLGAFALRRRG